MKISETWLWCHNNNINVSRPRGFSCYNTGDNDINWSHCRWHYNSQLPERVGIYCLATGLRALTIQTPQLQSQHGRLWRCWKLLAAIFLIICRWSSQKIYSFRSTPSQISSSENNIYIFQLKWMQKSKACFCCSGCLTDCAPANLTWHKSIK